VIIATGFKVKGDRGYGERRKCQGTGCTGARMCGFFFGRRIAVICVETALRRRCPHTVRQGTVTSVHRREHAARVEDHAGAGVRHPRSRSVGQRLLSKGGDGTVPRDEGQGKWNTGEESVIPVGGGL